MKTVPQLTPDQAAALVPDGAILMAGGFGMTGNPVHLLNALAERDVKNLTYIGNNVGEPGLGGGRLLRNGQIKKAIGSFFTSNPEAVKAYQAVHRRFSCSRRARWPRRSAPAGRALAASTRPPASARSCRKRRGADVRRRGICVRAWTARRRGFRARLARRYGRQSRLPHDRAQLQPVDGDRRRSGDRRGRRNRAGGR